MPTANVPDGDVNCDDQVSAADLTALAGLIPSSDFGPCDSADVNHDGVVNELDMTALVGVIFGSPAAP